MTRLHPGVIIHGHSDHSMPGGVGSLRPRLFLSLSLAIITLCSCGRRSEDSTHSFRVNVYGSRMISFVTHFWESTGFCPPEPHQNFSAFFLSDDEYQNLAHIGATPNQGIKQVRIHWLLDLITASITEKGEILYNFTALDQALDMLHQNGLKPGFEIMGNPSDVFADFEYKLEVYAWRNLVSTIAKRYIDRYSLEYVSSWNFETWNEPDHHDFDTVNFTHQGFLNYYDACLEGLKFVHPSLQLGAPAETAFGKDSYAMLLQQHCYNGTNYFTGDKGVELDYLSFHLKGRGSAEFIIEDTAYTYETTRSLFPEFQHIPFYNDEADPLEGWNKIEVWRADTTYAAVVVKVIALHQNVLFPRFQGSLNYQLLSNDNGFMNFGPPAFFDQRTLTARFPMNLTKPRSVEFIRKPVLSVMGLLSLVGSQQVLTTVFQDGVAIANNSDVGTVATVLPPEQSPTKTLEVAILIYRSNDTSNRTENTSVCELLWQSMPDLGSSAVFVHYQLDNRLERNPYAIWLQGGKPNFPPYKLLQEMRDAADFMMSAGPLPFSRKGTYSFLLPLPSVVLIHACQKPANHPSKVTEVRLHGVISGENMTEIMIIWNDVPERCILTYEVAMSQQVNGTYTQVNTVNTIFSIHVHWYTDYSPGMKLYYRVRAVDYWHRPGAYSDPVCAGC